MAFHGKKYTQAAAKADRDTLYTMEGAIQFLKDHPTTKFDATAEIAFRLGVDPTKSDQAVRGTVTLPHGTGKTVRVLVFASGPAADAAREAGADHVGFEDLLAKVQGGFTEFDVAVATPDAMKEVRKLGKVLGPRGLMPNPKTGTVSDDTAAAVKACKAGRVEFRMDRHGNVMVPFGKMSFEAAALRENGKAVMDALNAARPSAAKGVFIKRATITSTMGPGLRLDPREFA
ncbi:MAG: 50S ribosomal protein L1 [Kiritimatiellae bacterium]|jgi:large subunit ribosomal protein L1|nr:50S ribosomal protein L1 [Kiritimatiellia bacterium]